MNSQGLFIIVLSLLSTASTCTAQQGPGQTPDYVTNPSAILNKWKWLETQKQVTSKFPTDYHIGGVYRLKQDVVVECGGTASHITKYWVSVWHTDGVEEVKQCLRDPQAAKEREIQSLQRVAADNPRLSVGTEIFIRGIRNRRETRSLLSKGTMLRFQQLWLQRSFEMGVTIQAYVEVLDGPLQGKWVDIKFLSKCETSPNPHCNLNSEYLECVAK